jgi:ADP-ribose pyrophosphatase YjhB (NUDIX family)/N-acetylglutamate synthase-like GNAT family acetyltransferase
MLILMSKQPAFCPICGHTLTEREEGGRLRPACDNCGYVHFVNPVPGVGLVIEMDGGVVLIKRGHPPHLGEWTLPSGFVEADESTEEAAIREAEEETGLKIELIEMAAINSFPEGPPVSGIMIFYRARPIGGELRAGDDAADVRVFKPNEIPLLPFRTHREMMALWLEKFADAEIKRQASPTPSLIIRPYAPPDTDEVLSLLATIPINRQLSEEDWQQVIWRMREGSNVEVFVAELPQNPPIIIACASLSVVRGLTDGIGLIGNMAVLPAYQRRGVGAELLSAMMRRASQLDLRSLWVNTQRANDQARALLCRTGF